VIRNIFKKDIKRTIEGVIKADNLNDESVFQEVDEYVITNDLSKKLDEFFEVYSSTIGKPTESIGVWISGFFGSGKSHLLKILSYILSNHRVHSDLIGELFMQKVQQDFELKNNIEKALKIPAHAILFNIDQKAQEEDKKRREAKQIAKEKSSKKGKNTIYREYTTEEISAMSSAKRRNLQDRGILPKNMSF
jgi:predicted ATPase